MHLIPRGADMPSQKPAPPYNPSNEGIAVRACPGTGRAHLPSAPESSFFALGAGQNAVWLDPDHDLVAVVRWIASDALDGFIRRVLAAL